MGVLHSVLRRRVPDVTVVDLTHGIARQDVRAGSFALARAAPYVADGAVVGVVDPGVGTQRAMIAVETVRTGGRHVFFVGPDNGLLTPAIDVIGGAAAAVVLKDTGYWLAGRGPTFAGRDVFAPAAAELARGAALHDVGDPIDPATLGRLPAPVLSRREEDGRLECEVTWVDHYGNVQLSVAESDLPGGAQWFEVGTGHSGPPVLASRARAFAELAAGQLGVLVDSEGRAALCLDGAHAAGALGVSEGDIISLRPSRGT